MNGHDRSAHDEPAAADLRVTQRALDAAIARAEAADASRTRFLATVSHELLTPLSAMLLSIELAQDPDASLPDIRRHLERASTSGATLHRIIGDVLDMATAEAGQIHLVSVTMSLEPCLRAAVAAAAALARTKGLDFTLTIDPALPSRVLGDPTRLRKIVSSLADNAVKFTDHGWVRVDVSQVAPEGPGRPTLEILVADSGTGMTAEAQSRVFERFVQSDDSTTRRQGGLGLGLSLVRSLAEALGGHVSVRSQPGEGTEVRATVPLTPHPLPEALQTNERPDRESPPAAPTRPPARILVAEDSDISYAVVHSCLSQAGYHVARALDGREAVAAAPQCNLILMDVEMPNMDGVEAACRIRTAEKEDGRAPVPILALTAHNLQIHRNRCMAAGCTGFLAKPIRVKPLLAAVANALKHGRGTAGQHGHAWAPEPPSQNGSEDLFQSETQGTLPHRPFPSDNESD